MSQDAKRKQSFILASFILFCGGVAFCQTEIPESNLPYSKPPQLSVVVNDSFSKDTRGQYAVDGNVRWQKGQLSLPIGSKLQIDRKAENWIEVESEINFPKLEKNGEQSSFQIWFDLDESPDPVIRLLQKREKSKIRSAIFVAKSGGNWSEAKELRAARKPLLVESDLPNGNWKFTYRDGQIQVATPDGAMYFVDLEIGWVTVDGVVLESQKGVHQLSSLQSKSTKNIRSSLTPEQLRLDKELRQKSMTVANLLNTANEKRAFPIANEIHKSRLTKLGRYSSEYIKSLLHLSVTLRSNGSLKEADQKMNEALNLAELVLGSNHPTTGFCLSDLGTLCTQLGRYGESEKLLLRSRRIRMANYGTEHPLYQTSTNNLAEFYRQTGAFEKAEPLAIEALELAKTLFGPNEIRYAVSLNNLALLYSRMSRLDEAEKLLSESFRIIKSKVGVNHPYVAVSMNNMGMHFELMGLYEEAIRYTSKALTLREKLYKKSHPHLANSLNNLGNLYVKTGAFEKAESLYLRAIEHWANLYGEQHPMYATGLNNLANVYEETRQYQKAIEYFSQSLAILERFQKTTGKYLPNHAGTLNNLANVCRSAGKIQEAETFYLKSLSVNESTVGRSHPDYSKTLTSLGLLYLDQKKFPAAKDAFFTANESFRKSHGEKHELFVRGQVNIARYYAAVGDRGKAKEIFESSNERLGNILGRQHPDCASLSYNYGQLLQETGDFELAAKQFIECIEINTNNAERFASILTGQQQRQYASNFSMYMDHLFSVAFSSEPLKTKAFALAINLKGATQLRQKMYRELLNDPASKKQFDAVRQITQQLYVHLSKPPTEYGWKQRLDRLQSKKQMFEKQIANKSQVLKITPPKSSLEDILNSIPVDAVFIDLHQFTKTRFVDSKRKSESRILAFMLRHKYPVQMIDLGNANSIYASIEKFRRQITSNQPYNSSETIAVGKQLRNQIWLQLEPHFGPCKKIFISPSGQLGTLPFAALPGKSKSSFLISDYDIATIPISKLIPEFAGAKSGSDEQLQSVLLLGDVDYDNSQPESGEDDTAEKSKKPSIPTELVRNNWSRLPETRLEIDSVKNTFLQTERSTIDQMIVLVGKEATESAFANATQKFNIIHLATHGFFAPKRFHSLSSANPASTTFGSPSTFNAGKSVSSRSPQYSPGLLSGLVFAGANSSIEEGGSDDGIMTAEEISFLPLENTQLVTLSACETGLGKAAGGEGLIGIQRAFQVAGARTTVASLWNVDDLATRKLMERFYKNMLVKKMGKLEALVDAQRWLLQNPKIHSDINRGIVGKAKNIKNRDQHEDYLHPRFWAAWTLSGDWR